MVKLTDKKKHLLCDVAFFAMLAVLAVAYAWKAPRGFGTVDESFYPTIPYRLWQGDSLISGEWHVSQLVGLLQYPYMLLFRHFSPNNDGVYLAYRYFYFATLIVCAAIVYIMLRRYDGKKCLGAFAAAALFVAYTPACSMTLSYNTMCIMSITLACTALITAKGKAGKYVFSGLAFASAVLCSPYLVLTYALYSILLFIKRGKLKKNGDTDGAAGLLRAWAFFSLGCGILAAVLAAFLFSRTTLSQILASVNGILSDPEHSGVTIWVKIARWFYFVFIFHWPMTVAAVGTLGVFAAWHYDKRREEHRWLYYVICGVYMLILLVYLNSLYIYNFRLNLSMPLATLIIYILGGRKEKRVFRLMYLPGLCYSFCVHLASNTGYNCINSALHICNIAGAYIIMDEAVLLWRDGKKRERISAAILAVCVSAQFVFVLKEVLTTSFSMYDGRIVDEVDMLYSKVEKGPFKGLYFYEDEHYDYNSYYDQTQIARDAEGKNVVYYMFAPWLYVADEKESSSFSGWMSFADTDILFERMMAYWEVNPDKVPDVVYIDKATFGWEKALTVLNPNCYPVTETEYGFLIQK